MSLYCIRVYQTSIDAPLRVNTTHMFLPTSIYPTPLVLGQVQVAERDAGYCPHSDVKAYITYIDTDKLDDARDEGRAIIRRYRKDVEGIDDGKQNT